MWEQFFRDCFCLCGDPSITEFAVFVLSAGLVYLFVEVVVGLFL